MSFSNYLNDENIINIRSIKNLSLNLNNSKMLLSSNKKYVAFYNLSEIIIINLITKTIHSKINITNDNKENISLKDNNIFIDDNDNLLYCIYTDYYSKIVFNNLNSINEYFELKNKKKILNFIYTKINYDIYMFLVTNDFNILLYKNNILKRINNIIDDINKINNEMNNNISFEINKMFFINETLTLLIFTSVGLIIPYGLFPEDEEEENENFINCYKMKIGNDITPLDYNPNENYIYINNNNVIDVKDIQKINLPNNNNEVFIIINFIINDNNNIICFRIKNVSDIDYINRINSPNYIITTYIYKNKPPFFYFFITCSDDYIYTVNYFNFIDFIQNNININTFYTLQNNYNSSISNIYITNGNILYNSNYPSYLNVLIIRILNEFEFIGEYKQLICYINDNNNNYDFQINNFKISTNVNDYFKFYYENNKNQTIISKFNEECFNLFKNDWEKINIPLDEKFDSYLLFLISKNANFSIKKYLSFRDSLNYNKFLVDNGKIFNTVKTLYEEIKNVLLFDYNIENLSNKKIENIIKECLSIIKICKKRNLNWNSKPFEKEKLNLKIELIKIEKVLFDIENFLLVINLNKDYKLFMEDYNNNNNDENNSFNNNINNNIINNNNINNINIDNNNNNNDICESLFFKVFSIRNEGVNVNKFENNFKNYFEVFSLDNIDDNIFKNNNKEVEEDEDNNQIISYINNLLYYTKFVLFNYYYFSLSNFNNDYLNNAKYFKNTLNEYKLYSNISNNLLKLTINKNNHNNNDISEFIHLKNFIYKLNKTKIINDNNLLNKILDLSKLNSNLLNVFYNFYKNNYNNIFYINIAYNIFINCEDFFSNEHEFISYLTILLNFFKYNNCFNFLKKISQKFLISNCNSELNKDILKEILNLNKYDDIKKSYFLVYQNLLENKMFEMLLNLNMNFLEIYIMKQFFNENSKEAEHLLIIFYIKHEKLKEAKEILKKYDNQKGNKINKELRKMYQDLIENYEKLNSNKELEDFQKLKDSLLKIENDLYKFLENNMNLVLKNINDNFNEDSNENNSEDNIIFSNENFNKNNRDNNNNIVFNNNNNSDDDDSN